MLLETYKHKYEKYKVKYTNAKNKINMLENKINKLEKKINEIEQTTITTKIKDNQIGGNNNIEYNDYRVETYDGGNKQGGYVGYGEFDGLNGVYINNGCYF